MKDEAKIREEPKILSIALTNISYLKKAHFKLKPGKAMTKSVIDIVGNNNYTFPLVREKACMTSSKVKGQLGGKTHNCSERGKRRIREKQGSGKEKKLH